MSISPKYISEWCEVGGKFKKPRFHFLNEDVFVFKLTGNSSWVVSGGTSTGLEKYQVCTVDVDDESGELYQSWGMIHPSTLQAAEAVLQKKIRALPINDDNVLLAALSRGTFPSELKSMHTEKSDDFFNYKPVIDCNRIDRVSVIVTRNGFDFVLTNVCFEMSRLNATLPLQDQFTVGYFLNFFRNNFLPDDSIQVIIKKETGEMNKQKTQWADSTKKISLYKEAKW